MEKELKSKLEVEDFKKDSDVSKETMQNVIESFKSYLKVLDEQELTKKDSQGKDYTIEKLIKQEKKLIRDCNSSIKGDCALIDDKGKMTSLNSTEKIIMNLITNINHIILIRKKIVELEK